MNETNQDVELNDYKEVIEEYQDKIIPKIFKADLLPGYSRPTLAQIEKAVVKLSRNQPNEDISLILIAYGVILGEALVRTIPGAEWVYEAPTLDLIRVKIPTVKENKEDDDVYALPIKRAFSLFQTKSLKDKNLTNYYDAIKKNAKVIEIAK